MTCAPLAVDPRFCASAASFSPSRLGAWDLTFRNGPDSALATTPTLAGAESPVPFPTSVTISGSGFTPTLSFTIPASFSPDAIRINIFDKSITLDNGTKDVVHSQALPAGTRSFVVPSTLSSGQPLKADNPYVLNIQVIETRGHADFSSNNNALILRRSSSFFDFTPLTSGAPPVVLLPTVGPDPDPTDSFGAPYQFSVGGIVAGEIIFVDPFVAIGYDFQIGAGDPNFASVLLPNVGDGVFDVIFGAAEDQTVLAGSQFFFPVGGVDRFSVRGIETSAGLNPDDVTAFITGLSFTADGAFTGTQTPVLAFVPDGAVPAPATGLLLAFGLVAIAARRILARK